MNCTFSLASAGSVVTHTWGPCPAMLQLPSLKKSLCSTHSVVRSHCLAIHALLPPQKAKNLLIWAVRSLPVPPIVLGNRVFLLSSPCWCWSCGRAACCVYSLNLPDSAYPPKSLLIGLGVPSAGPGLQEGWELLSHIFCLFSSAAGTSCKVFPLHLIKSLTGLCKASSVCLGFKN